MSMDLTSNGQKLCGSKSLRMSEQGHFDNLRYISDDEMSTDGYQQVKTEPIQDFNTGFCLLPSLYSGSTESGGTHPIQILDQQGSSFNILNGTYISLGRFEPELILSDILLKDPLLDTTAFVPVNLEPEPMAAHRSLQQKTMTNFNVPRHQNVSNDVSQQNDTPSSYPENIYILYMDANTQRDYGSDPTAHDEGGSMPESDQPFFSQNGYSASGSHTSQQDYQNAQRTPELENDDELCLGKEMFIWLLDCLRWLNIEAIRNPCKDYFRPSLIPLGNAFNIILAANYEFLKQLPKTSHQPHHNFYCSFQHDPIVEEVGSTPPNNNEDEIIIG